jgi:hypothetical protein
MASSTHDLVGRLLEADGVSLERWRTDGLTLAEISFQLRDRYDVRISVETIRRWLADEDRSAEPTGAAS